MRCGSAKERGLTGKAMNRKVEEEGEGGGG